VPVTLVTASPLSDPSRATRIRTVELPGAVPAAPESVTEVLLVLPVSQVLRAFVVHTAPAAHPRDTVMLPTELAAGSYE